MENLILTLPKKESTKTTLLSLLKELNISFEMTDQLKLSQEFVEMVQQGREDLKNGKGIELTAERLKNLRRQ